MKRFPLLPIFLIVLSLFSSGQHLQAQGATAFSYQGQLSAAGVPATGSFDMEFTVFNSNSAGSALGSPVVNPAIGVTNGLFNVTLDFGAGVFTGSALWLEIGVRPSGSNNAYVILTPRQQVLPVPYALYAMTPAGPQGPQGVQGPSGPAGTNGTNGAQGAAGAQGAQGAQGPQGAVGPTGPQGPAGTNGLSIVGPQGLQGLQGPAGMDGTNGINGTNGVDGISPVNFIPNMQVFTNDGTFVVPTNITRIMVEVWGGGGSGGNGDADITGSFENQYGTVYPEYVSAVGGGGGAGGYGKGIFSVTNGATFTVQVGPGGYQGGDEELAAGGTSFFIDSSRNILIYAMGGGPGGDGNALIVSEYGDGNGDGGTGGTSSGMINITGESGDIGQYSSGGVDESAGGGNGGAAGNGGSGGKYGFSNIDPSVANGFSGNDPGGGGGGAGVGVDANYYPIIGVGGNGGQGRIVVYW